MECLGSFSYFFFLAGSGGRWGGGELTWPAAVLLMGYIVIDQRSSKVEKHGKSSF